MVEANQNMARNISLVMLFVALLAPAYIVFFPWVEHYLGFHIFSITWTLYCLPNEVRIVPIFWLTVFGLFQMPFQFIVKLPTTFLRFVFAYMIFRYYKGRTTKKRTLIVGVVSELQMVLLMLFSYLPGISLSFLYPHFEDLLAVPIPILLLTGIVIIKLKAPPESKVVWKELENGER